MNQHPGDVGTRGGSFVRYTTCRHLGHILIVIRRRGIKDIDQFLSNQSFHLSNPCSSWNQSWESVQVSLVGGRNPAPGAITDTPGGCVSWKLGPGADPRHWATASRLGCTLSAPQPCELLLLGLKCVHVLYTRHGLP